MILAFAGVELDLDLYELRRADARVAIEPQVFDVLVDLVSNAPRVVSKEELLDTVWGDRFVSESALTSRIKAARRAVGDDGTRQAVIATVHGRGYRVVVDVEQRDGSQRAVAEPSPRPPEPATSTCSNATTTSRSSTARSSREGRLRPVGVRGGRGRHRQELPAGELRRPPPWPGARVVVGCDDLLAPRPLGPIRDLVAQLPDDLQAEAADDLSGASLARVLLRAGANGAASSSSRTSTGPTTPPSRDPPAHVAAARPALRDRHLLSGRGRGPRPPDAEAVGHDPRAACGPSPPRSPQRRLGCSPRRRLAGGRRGGVRRQRRQPAVRDRLIATPPGDLPEPSRTRSSAASANSPAEDVEVVRAISVLPVRIQRQLVELLCGNGESSLVGRTTRDHRR